MSKACDLDFPILPKPAWTHDCTNCEYLGQTIGGGRLVDLYAHPSKHLGDISRDATIIARYGNDGPEYYSTIAKMARPEGHAELYVGARIWLRKHGLT